MDTHVKYQVPALGIRDVVEKPNGKYVDLTAPRQPGESGFSNLEDGTLAIDTDRSIPLGSLF